MLGADVCRDRSCWTRAYVIPNLIRDPEIAMYVYILANKKNGTLYIGVTNDLERRIAEHKSGLVPGFTQKYNVKILVWCEEFPGITEAIEREKQLKNWHRAWKIALIEQTNPEWRDLAEEADPETSSG